MTSFWRVYSGFSVLVTLGRILLGLAQLAADQVELVLLRSEGALVVAKQALGVVEVGPAGVVVHADEAIVVGELKLGPGPVGELVGALLLLELGLEIVSGPLDQVLVALGELLGVALVDAVDEMPYSPRVPAPVADADDVGADLLRRQPNHDVAQDLLQQELVLARVAGIVAFGDPALFDDRLQEGPVQDVLAYRGQEGLVRDGEGHPAIEGIQGALVEDLDAYRSLVLLGQQEPQRPRDEHHGHEGTHDPPDAPREDPQVVGETDRGRLPWSLDGDFGAHERLPLPPIRRCTPCRSDPRCHRRSSPGCTGSGRRNSSPGRSSRREQRLRRRSERCSRAASAEPR